MSNVNMKIINGKFKAEGKKYQILASTADVDRDNEIILPSAFKNLDTYLKTNPVILLGHEYRGLPIGKAVDGKITEKALILEIEFADTELGNEVKYLYENGFMNAFSVGFIPKSWEMQENERGPVRVYTEVELLEVSAVTLPANQFALMLRQAENGFGKKLEQVAKACNIDQKVGGADRAEGGKGTAKKSTVVDRKSKIKLFASRVK